MIHAAVDERLELEQVGGDDQVLGQPGFGVPQRRHDAVGYSPGVGVRLLHHRDDHARLAVDPGITPFGGRPFLDGGDLAEQHIPPAIGPHRDHPQVGKHLRRFRPQAGDHSHRSLDGSLLGETAAGVEVVLPDRLIHVPEADAVLLKLLRIDQHLVLFEVPPHHDDLGNAGFLEQAGTDYPVRQGSQLTPAGIGRSLGKVGFVPGNADHHDLAHDGTGGCHQWPDAGGQGAGDRGETLLDDLPCVANLGLPAELDIGHDQSLAGLAADRLNPLGAEQHGFDRNADRCLDLLRRQSGTFRQQHDARPIEVRKDVNRHGCRQVGAVTDHHQGEHERRKTVG